MDFEVPADSQGLLDDMDEFIKSEIKPVEETHQEFFDHRREYARTDWADGTPSEKWEMILDEMRDLSEEAGFYRMNLPKELGGSGADMLTITMANEHLAKKGPGLHNVVHTGIGWESLISKWRHVKSILEHGTEEQKDEYLEALVNREIDMAFGMTEPNHGSDPRYMETTARKDGDEWVVNGEKRFIGGMHKADYIRLFARSSGEIGDANGITTFLVPTNADGFNVEYFHWTMNMPSTQAEITITDVRVPENAVLGDLGKGLQQQGRQFLIEGWHGQATMAIGTAQYCINETVKYANQREISGKALSERQAIQFPLAHLHGEAELVRNLIYKVAWMIDEGKDLDRITELVSIANYRANQLACAAADQAIQVHGGKGWTRHYPFEYLYRQFRRYRITEGADEVQKRRIGGYLFNFI